MLPRSSALTHVGRRGLEHHNRADAEVVTQFDGVNCGGLRSPKSCLDDQYLAVSLNTVRNSSRGLGCTPKSPSVGSTPLTTLSVFSSLT